MATRLFSPSDDADLTRNAEDEARAALPVMTVDGEMIARVRRLAEEFKFSEDSDDYDSDGLFLLAVANELEAAVAVRARLVGHLHWVACQIGFATDGAIRNYLDCALARARGEG